MHISKKLLCSRLRACSRRPSRLFFFFFFLHFSFVHRCTELDRRVLSSKCLCCRGWACVGLLWIELMSVHSCISRLRIHASRQSGKEAKGWKLRSERRRWLPDWAIRDGITTRASCLSSLGWRSVREASSWPVGPTDGAFGWGAKKPLVGRCGWLTSPQHPVQSWGRPLLHLII